MKMIDHRQYFLISSAMYLAVWIVRMPDEQDED